MIAVLSSNMNSLYTGHQIDYSSPSVLAADNVHTRLNIKETLVNELGAFRSLNRNVGSFELHLI